MRTLCIALALAAALPGAGLPADFDPGKAPFHLTFRDVTSPYRVFFLTALPGERVTIGSKEPGDLRLETVDGAALAPPGKRVEWTAPGSPGVVRLRVFHAGAPEPVELIAFVLVPFASVMDGELSGYRIGSYPRTPWKGLPIYRPPRGFIEVTENNRDTMISPHFRLGQFLCKQDGGYPKYVVLREKLLLKLELVLEKTNEAGHACETFAVMSGYRTPFYNQAIGNVKYSRHVWGGAADVFIDENPRDDVMDDLNADGKTDYRDAAVLYDIIDDLYGRPFFSPLVGGLAHYRKTAAHGPFVHVDVRGFRVRWGD